MVVGGIFTHDTPSDDSVVTTERQVGLVATRLSGYGGHRVAAHNAVVTKLVVNVNRVIAHTLGKRSCEAGRQVSTTACRILVQVGIVQQRHHREQHRHRAALHLDVVKIPSRVGDTGIGSSGFQHVTDQQLTIGQRSRKHMLGHFETFAFPPGIVWRGAAPSNIRLQGERTRTRKVGATTTPRIVVEIGTIQTRPVGFAN